MTPACKWRGTCTRGIKIDVNSAVSIHHSCSCLRAEKRRPSLRVDATAERDNGFSHPGLELATHFSSFVNREGLENPLAGRRPTPFMPPTTVIATQLDALQRNDWPEPNAGVRTAFAFAKPRECETFFPGQVRGTPDEGHSWGGREPWLSWDDFLRMISEPPFDVLIGADSWEPASPMVFPQTRKSTTAVQAVKVRASRRQNPAHMAPGAGEPAQGLREYTFTFCLERILVGPYKDIWLTTGVRVGDYANV